MTSTRASKLTFTVLSTAILMAVVAALLFATPHGAFAAAPDRPTDLTATAVDHDTVSLTWSHPDPATVDHYRVLSRQSRLRSIGQLIQVGTVNHHIIRARRPGARVHVRLPGQARQLHGRRGPTFSTRRSHHACRGHACTTGQSNTRTGPNAGPASAKR